MIRMSDLFNRMNKMLPRAAKASPKADRGDVTREALIKAAIEIFGRDGFHAASTRAIAERAGANQALIGYHFRGKLGLYHATFEYIIGKIAARITTAHLPTLVMRLAVAFDDQPTRDEEVDPPDAVESAAVGVGRR